jgi:hypothetical protein
MMAGDAARRSVRQRAGSSRFSSSIQFWTTTMCGAGDL